MFCPKCGANVPEGTPFCGSCGTPLNAQQQAPVQQPTYQAPVQQPTYRPAPQQPAYQPTYQPVQQPQPMRPAPVAVSKREFLSKHADSATKKNSLLVTICFLLTLVLIAASIIVPLATPFFNIPIVSTILSADGMDADEMMEEMEYSVDEIKEDFRAQKQYMDDDEQEAAEAVIDGVDALIENFSVLNLKNLLSLVGDVGVDYMDSSDLQTLEEIGMIMDVIIGILIGAFVLPLLFALLGGLLKSTGLTVTALVFTVLSQLILCGLVYVLLSLVIFIVQAVLCSKLTKAYNSYRYGIAL